MTNPTLDKDHQDNLVPDTSTLTEGTCPKCAGLGIVFKKPGFNGRRPSIPIQCPECGGTGEKLKM